MIKLNGKLIAAIIGSASLALATPFIGGWEGKRNDPYNDVVGVKTVCYGETRVPMRRYSDAECTAMLEKAVEGFRKEVVQCTPNLAERPYQQAAATSLAYNIGISAYCRSTADRKFDQGDFRGGCEAFKLWNKAGGKVVKGLVNRRQEEYELCVKGL